MVGIKIIITLNAFKPFYIYLILLVFSQPELSVGKWVRSWNLEKEKAMYRRKERRMILMV